MAEILILGAGMAGIGAALALQERGHTVRLVDRRAPGEETSFGNAGVIQAEAMEPYAMPRDIATLWRYALGLSNDVAWSLRDLPRFAPALLAYFRASAPARHARISKVYSRLIGQAVADHSPLIEAAGADNLIRRTGLGEVFRDRRTFDAARTAAEATAARYGLALRVLDASRLRAEDPAFTADLAGALVWEDSWSCLDPGGLVQAYARLFERRGGIFAKGDAATLTWANPGWRVTTEDGAAEAEHAVIALGPWSAELVGRFGYKATMLLKRGYHTHLDMQVPLSRPYHDAANGIVLSSMREGLRLTTGAELVRPDRPGSDRQLKRGLQVAAELVGAHAKPDARVWRGHRPCMPDMLPVVGPVPGQVGLWLHFGHGHQGFTLGPTTGRILAAQLDGAEPDLGLKWTD
jgi:D-amino-acid dehydrogenase